jgi:hypothetical protein
MPAAPVSAGLLQPGDLSGTMKVIAKKVNLVI